MIKYSPSMNGFYDTETHGRNIPSDAVDVTRAEHQALLDAQSAGKRIEADASGNPVAVAIVPTQAELAAAARAERDARIDAIRWRYERHAREQRLGLPLSDDIAVLDAYVQALADVSKQPGFPDHIVWPALPGMQ